MWKVDRIPRTNAGDKKVASSSKAGKVYCHETPVSTRTT